MLLTFDKKSMPAQCYEFIANHFRTTFVYECQLHITVASY